ncbi:MAG: hypothetical protein EU543_03120 [Promethearchaeota archaeon]|nr:MAG: hypothetical protein EU543_03120 [Candidatus Lokiarchaeota archaeon]
MVWGGSLNSRGSDYLKHLHEANKAVEFLEKIKGKIKLEDKDYIRKTIDIITDYINKLAEGQK